MTQAVAVAALPYEARNALLNGPTILLIVSHAGTELDYFHQCSAASGVVSADRSRQLSEQMQSNNRSFKIEVPQQAFAAVSPAFGEWLELNSNATFATIDLGPLLPGYAMSVLDWLVRTLKAKAWNTFTPADASTAGLDKWYWIYCYAAMRVLGMTQLADDQQVSVQNLITAHDAVKTYDDYIHLLHVCGPSDTVMLCLTQWTAQSIAAGTLTLSAVDCSQLATAFPVFGDAVNEYLAECRSSKQDDDDPMEQ